MRVFCLDAVEGHVGWRCGLDFVRARLVAVRVLQREDEGCFLGEGGFRF